MGIRVPVIATDLCLILVRIFDESQRLGLYGIHLSSIEALMKLSCISTLILIQSVLGSISESTLQYCQQVKLLATKLGLLVELPLGEAELEDPGFLELPCGLPWNTKKLIPRRFNNVVNTNTFNFWHIDDPTLPMEQIKGRMLLVPQLKLGNGYNNILLCINGRLLVLAAGLFKRNNKTAAFTFDLAHKRATLLTLEGEGTETLALARRTVAEDSWIKYYRVVKDGILSHNQQFLLGLTKPNEEGEYPFELLLYHEIGPLLQAVDIINIPLCQKIFNIDSNVNPETESSHLTAQRGCSVRDQGIYLIKLIQLLKYFHAQHGLNTQFEDKLFQDISNYIDSYDQSSSRQEQDGKIFVEIIEFISDLVSKYGNIGLGLGFKAFISREPRLIDNFLVPDPVDECSSTVFNSDFPFDQQMFDASTCHRLLPCSVPFGGTIPFSLALGVRKMEEGNESRLINLELCAFIDEARSLYIFQKKVISSQLPFLGQTTRLKL